ncbi:lactonase family protein [Burkholderia sp. Ax-1719]|uniref:lactonase family protein n=1 Tax=Burkholderia sp. Ax-1719 TaxID=2608334 RepID=UPI0014223D36|nr:lactonase family protein [Burkholderia sp. Ax-1719]NIE66331.1 lactonase family protein [Burkholderia sp. Ax-1719]
MAHSLKQHASRLAINAALVACASIYGVACTTAIPASSSNATTEFAYVGTQQKQISALRLDTATGKLVALGTAAQGPNATWVASHPALPVLYAVDDERDKEGSITAYAVNRSTGKLERINNVLTGGMGTTFLQFDAPSSTLLGANYNSGSVSSVAVSGDGSVGKLESIIAEKGSGPSPRQKSAHAHGVTIDPSGRYALVPDLGADRIFIYRFDRDTHVLTPRTGDAQPAFDAPPGSGPRRILFSANGEYAYVLTEMSAELIALRWDAAKGALTPLQTTPITSTTFSGVKSGAEMAFGRDRRFLYVENRAENALMVYRVDAATGQVALVQRTSSGGEKPWGFGIDASGQWMLVANQHSGDVHLFHIDTATGTLADTGQSIAVQDPTSIAFVQ